MRIEATNGFAGNWERLVNKIAEYVPFTASNLVWRSLDDSNESLLDVGCGRGRPGAIIKKHKNIFSVGVDAFGPYLRRCKENHTHDELVQCDVKALPFKDERFDAVLCKEVIEHLDGREGDALIRQLERIAQRQITITTPVGAYEQHRYDDNPAQEDRSCRWPSDMKRFGYTVSGVGIRGMGGERGIRNRVSRWLASFVDVAYV